MFGSITKLYKSSELKPIILVSAAFSRVSYILAKTAAFRSRLARFHGLRFFSELSSPTRNMSRNPMKSKTIITPMPNRWLPDQ